jgi:hypothetical protein
MLLIDYKKSVKYDAFGFIPKTFGTEGSFWGAFKKVFQWKVNILFEKKNLNKINGKKG